MRAPPPPACLMKCFAGSSYLLTDKVSPPDDDWFLEGARLFNLPPGGESAVALACLCDGTGTLYRLFSVA